MIPAPHLLVKFAVSSTPLIARFKSSLKRLVSYEKRFTCTSTRGQYSTSKICLTHQPVCAIPLPCRPKPIVDRLGWRILRIPYGVEALEVLLRLGSRLFWCFHWQVNLPGRPSLTFQPSHLVNLCCGEIRERAVHQPIPESSLLPNPANLQQPEKAVPVYPPSHGSA